MSYERPKGYAHETSARQTVIFWGVLAALFGLKFWFLIWSGAVLLTMLLFYGGGFLAIVFYERWKSGLPSPVLTVPSTLQQGEQIIVDLTFTTPNAVELVEVVGTSSRSRRTEHGSSTTHHRVAAQQLNDQADQTDATSGHWTFAGRVPQTRSFASKWFIAVHIRHNRYLKYVRAYPVTVQTASMRQRK